MVKVVVIIQARMGSTRLPGKVLKDISGKPLLWHVINRVKKAKRVNQIILATTNKKEDSNLLELAKETGIESYYGSEDDVLDRYFQAATKYNADVIVRITADCPLTDPQVIDNAIQYFLDFESLDYVTNTFKCTYPDGLDVEVFSYDALKKMWCEAKLPSEREHVTAYIRNHKESFNILNFELNEDYSNLRWTVDEERDLTFVRDVYRRLYVEENEIFYMKGILELLNKNPELTEINSGIIRNEGYLKSLKKDKISKY